MTDIVERLRAFNYPPGNITHEAADEIERLRECLKAKNDPNLIYPGKDHDFVFPEE